MEDDTGPLIDSFTAEEWAGNVALIKLFCQHKNATLMK